VTGEVFCTSPTAHPHPAPVAQVGEDTQAELALGQARQRRPHRFRDAVDDVRSHRVQTIDGDVDDHVPLAERAHPELRRPASARDQAGHPLAAQREQRVALEQDALGGDSGSLTS
jgi:hypothetical protein